MDSTAEAYREAALAWKKASEVWEELYKMAKAQLNDPNYMYAGSRISRLALEVRNDEITAFHEAMTKLSKIVGLDRVGENGELLEKRLRELVTNQPGGGDVQA